MSTARTVSFDYAESPSEVAALLQDPIYLRQRSESAGEHNIDVQVEHTSSGVRITVTREKDVDLPAFAKVVLGSARRAVETTLWSQSGESWTAEYKIEVGGVPVTTTGRSTLAPNADGCRYTSRFEIDAKIPFIGKRIEPVVADALTVQLLDNAKRNAEALARGKAAPHSYINSLRGDAVKTGNEG